jgi:preprotein translocase subunit SecF
MVAAILTVIGYSMNDTVVVFDRLRENLRKYKKMPCAR